jgi:formate-dependent nitrite reductase membrane component NrfD
MNPLAPLRQSVWGKLAVSNFFFGGAGAGLYVLAVVLQVVSPEETASVFTPFSLLAPTLVLIGFLSVAAEAGRPFRGPNVLLNVKRSWMSRELLAGLSFVGVALADWLWPSPFLKGFAIMAALGCVLSQGFILLRARGVPAWNLPVLPILFLTSGFLTGIGILLILTPALGAREEITKQLGLIAVAFAAVNLSVWFYYLCQPEVAKVLNRAMRGGVMGLGHILPVLLILAGVGFPGSLPVMVVISGVAIVVGEILLKDAVIRQAGYLVGIGVPLRAAQVRESGFG